MAKGKLNFEETSGLGRAGRPAAELFAAAGGGPGGAGPRGDDARDQVDVPQKVRVFTDVTMVEVDRIDRIVARQQKGQPKVVKRAAIIRKLILEGLKHVQE